MIANQIGRTLGRISRTLRELVLPTLCQAMSAFLARFPDHEREELRIYFLATPSPAPGAGDQGSDVDVLIYVQAPSRRASWSPPLCDPLPVEPISS